MRIYGITYDHTRNYGSNLQSYALQHAIEQLKIAGEQCEYQLIPLKAFRDAPDDLYLKHKNHFLMYKVIRKLLKPIYHLHFSQFKNFYTNHLHFADIHWMKDLAPLNAKADAFVCGSDVVWNSMFNFYCGAYYLDFAEKYKFSYAASFGKSDLYEREIAQAKQYLPSFSEISCREKSGCELVKKYTGREAVVVADPVLLLSADDWNRVAEAPRAGEKYIFAYITQINDNLRGFIRALQEKTGLRVIYSTFGSVQTLRLGILQVQSPEKWLRLLRDAEYVVTNSFHATAFCTIYHKKFFTVVKGEAGKSTNVRMHDFLRMIGLENRLFSSPEGIDLGEVDYTRADETIAGLREESLAFLRRNLEAAYRQRAAVSKGE